MKLSFSGSARTMLEKVPKVSNSDGPEKGCCNTAKRCETFNPEIWLEHFIGPSHVGHRKKCFLFVVDSKSK